MFDLLHWANGWIDWNLIVNHNGGINHLGNDCEAPIVTTKDFDDIIIVPKFYYMGHFSKFVKPDSIRIGSSFTGSYQYSKIDPNVRAGFELGLFNCEQSSRQMWEVTHEKRIRLVVPAIDSEWETIGIEKKVNLCFGPGDTNRPYLHIVDCMSNETSPYEFEFTSNGMMVEIESGDCLTVADDVTVPGGLLHLERCVDYRDNHTPPSPSQQFYYDENTHELVSLIASSYNEDGTVDTDGLCVTAGWPFFTGAAFLDDNHRTIVVIMSDTSNGDVWFGINARSIQTIVY
jgi:glucosylceramidase